MTATSALTENEREVLGVLGELMPGELFPFWWIMDYFQERPLTRDQVREACRGLAAKGLAKYGRGRLGYYGNFTGAGYGHTRKGRWHISAMIRASRSRAADYEALLDSLA